MEGRRAGGHGCAAPVGPGTVVEVDEARVWEPGRSAEVVVEHEVVLRDGTTQTIRGADAYAQEGQMTTFFATGERGVVDCWAVRVASVRTAEIRLVHRRMRRAA